MHISLKLIFCWLSLSLLTSCGFDQPVKPLSLDQKLCVGFQTVKKQSVFWTADFPIEIHINKSFPEAYRPYVDLALQSWNQKFETPLFILNPLIDNSNQMNEDTRNTLYWVNRWDYASDILGSTFIYTHGNNITEADIILNRENYVSEDLATLEDFDVTSLIVHELGHLLGLDHNDEHLGSVMKTKLDAHTTHLEISDFDLANISCMYPEVKAKKEL